MSAVETVGQLRELLERVPDSTPVVVDEPWSMWAPTGIERGPALEVEVRGWALVVQVPTEDDNCMWG
jgi:hypothetical protein